MEKKLFEEKYQGEQKMHSAGLTAKAALGSYFI